MKRIHLFIAAVFALSMCCIAFAQDRGVASAIAWSPDGATIAVASTTGLWLFDNHFNDVGHVEIEQTDDESTRDVEWNAGGDLIAMSSDWFGPIRIINVRKLEVVNEIKNLSITVPVLWHPIEDQVIAGTIFTTTRIFDAATGEELFFLDLRDVWPNANRLVLETQGLCWNSANTIGIVDREFTHFVGLDGTLKLGGRVKRGVGLYGAVCNHEYRVISRMGRLFDAHTGTMTPIDDEYFDPAMGVAWSPISSHFVASLRGCRTRVFDGDTGDLVAELPGGVRGLSGLWTFDDSIAWRPDGSRFAIVGQFGDIRVWDAETYELLQRFDGFDVEPIVPPSADSPEQVSDAKCP